MPRLAVVLAASLLGASAVAAPVSPPGDAAARLVGGALVGGRSFELVQSLTDGVGQRLAGTPAADRAVEWAVHAMERSGLARVHREPVKVPRWVRGDATVEITAPAPHPLHAVALGNSVGTNDGGVAAEVVAVTSLAELQALGAAKVKGKIVLFDQAMVRSNSFESYGAVVAMRSTGAIEAARLGASAALIRSVGTGAFRLPHTGATHYDDAVAKIPFAAVAAEDADLIRRLIATGAPVRMRIRMSCKADGVVDSANVVGDLVGGERPDEVVLLGAHLDSWDLGTGAIDDGAGVAIVLEAARLIAGLGRAPRRTLRVVLFMNEEHGGDGAKAYVDRHLAELPKHVAAIESDSGAGRPMGFIVAGGPPSVAMVRTLIAPLASLHIDRVQATPQAGADVGKLQEKGVPVLGVAQELTSYFDWHHTAADTLDKIDPIDLALDAGAVAVLAHALLETAGRLPAPTEPTKP